MTRLCSLAVLTLLVVNGARAFSQGPVRVDTVSATTAERQIRALEDQWNDAHIRGDTVALFGQFGSDITVTVPNMPTMNRQDLMSFWRSGRANVLRHETDSVRIRTWNDAAVVEGILRRQRNFNGRVQEDRWRFTKTYFRRDGSWQVVAYHASPVAASR
jgi:hypothetical protein